MQAAQGTRVSGGMDVDCSGCGDCVDIGDELGDAVDDVDGDTDGDEWGIDHGNTSGTLDPDFLNPRFEKCALQMRLLTVISVGVLPMRSNHTFSSFWFLNGSR
jgi:hypothetical protein